tara:strand:- start:255 stop:473 length:219 start_codon:yes stop_codon:yes gene_type:complete
MTDHELLKFCISEKPKIVKMVYKRIDWHNLFEVEEYNEEFVKMSPYDEKDGNCFGKPFLVDSQAIEEIKMIR